MTGLTSDLQVALPETLDPLRLTGGAWQNNSFRGGRDHFHCVSFRAEMASVRAGRVPRDTAAV